VLELAELPAPETELVYEGKTVGRITSAAAVDGGAVALAYVRREIPDDAKLTVGSHAATLTAPRRP
jgi:folate-binding Fe-S cluster repair protein YgfZ